MKKFMKKFILFVLILLLLGVYYYFTLPAINIHSQGFWVVLIVFILSLTMIYALVKARKQSAGNIVQIRPFEQAFKDMKAVDRKSVV